MIRDELLGEDVDLPLGRTELITNTRKGQGERVESFAVRVIGILSSRTANLPFSIIYLAKESNYIGIIDLRH